MRLPPDLVASFLQRQPQQGGRAQGAGLEMPPRAVEHLDLAEEVAGRDVAHPLDRLPDHHVADDHAAALHQVKAVADVVALEDGLVRAEAPLLAARLQLRQPAFVDPLENRHLPQERGGHDPPPPKRSSSRLFRLNDDPW